MKPMTVLILTRKPDVYAVRRLAEECQKKGHNPRLLDPEDEHVLNEKPDRVLPRFGSYRFEDSLATLEYFERRGYPCLNGTTPYRDARNKWICSLHLQENGLPVPQTTLANKAARPAKFPVVLKPLDGTGGEGIFVVHDATEWMALPADREWVQQEFIAEARNRDLRIFVLGGKVLGAIERRAKDGDFRANLHQGGEAFAITPTGTELRYALESVKALGLDVAGVDLIRSSRGPLILEVNPCPGFEGLEKATGVNIAAAMIDYLTEKTR